VQEAAFIYEQYVYRHAFLNAKPPTGSALGLRRIFSMSIAAQWRALYKKANNVIPSPVAEAKKGDA
jgi:hypothetical protein